MYAPVALTPGLWGVDTSARLTPALLDQLLTVDLHDFCASAPKGTAIDFFGRYVPLPYNGVGNDVTSAELQAIAARKRKVVLFQHVRAGSWMASPQQGADDAVHAAAYAKSVGYAPLDGYPGPAIVKDMESVANPGPAAVGCMRSYIDAMQAHGFQAPGYCGFASGLTPAQWSALGVPVMSDFGQRQPPPGRGFAIKQHPEVVIFGVRFDVDEILADLTGAFVYAMGDIEINEPSPPEPHIDPTGPSTDV